MQGGTSSRLVISKPDLARRFGVSVRTLNRWIAAGDLPAPFHMPHSRHAYWRLQTVAALLERMESRKDLTRSEASTHPSPGKKRRQ